MKKSVLPHRLRLLFTALRLSCLIFGIVFIFILILGPALSRRLVGGSDAPRIMVAIGEAMLPGSPTAPAASGSGFEIPDAASRVNVLTLDSDTAEPGSIEMAGLRGSLHLNLLSEDSELLWALHWNVFPVLLSIGFAYFLFGKLRAICLNLERGEVFIDANFRLIRGIGWLLVWLNLAFLPAAIWADWTMTDYLATHVSLPAGFLPDGTGSLAFETAGEFPNLASLVTGLVVLMLSEAFRQGLALKAENDLTV